MKITVLGAGSWGTTLAILLHENGHNVLLWTFDNQQAESIIELRENVQFLPGIKIPQDIGITTDIENACYKCNMIVTAIPSQFLRSVLQRIAHLNLSETIICNVAKGIETGSLMTMSEVLLDVLMQERKDNIAILSGPSHAEEVCKKIPTMIVSASYKLKTARFVQEAFTNNYFRVFVNEDIRGVELGGAFKNVIAIAAGLSDGAGFGDNTKAAIMTRGIYEITRLGAKMGAQPITFAGLSGMGDLIVTCMSKYSRNRYVGEEIGKGRSVAEVLSEMKMVAEGVPTAKSVHQLAKKYHVEMPMAEEVYKVLYEGKDPRKATIDLMLRDNTSIGAH